MNKIRTCDIKRKLPSWAKIVKRINDTPIYNMSVLDNIELCFKIMEYTLYTFTHFMVKKLRFYAVFKLPIPTQKEQFNELLFYHAISNYFLRLASSLVSSSAISLGSLSPN